MHGKLLVAPLFRVTKTSTHAKVGFETHTFNKFLVILVLHKNRVTKKIEGVELDDEAIQLNFLDVKVVVCDVWCHPKKKKKKIDSNNTCGWRVIGFQVRIPKV